MSIELLQETEILQSLSEGHLDRAEQLLAAWNPANSLEKSRHFYLQAKIHLYRGSYSQALPLLQVSANLIAEQDLDVLNDKALCFYQLGIPEELSQTIELGIELLKSQSPINSSQKSLNHAIFLSKLTEEMGAFDKTLMLLQFAECLDLQGQQRKALQIQQLRVSIEMGNISWARELYSSIIKGTDHSQSFEIEREHALFLADIHLFGIETAEERLRYLLSLNLTPADKSFLQSEMIEHSILNRYSSFFRSAQPFHNSENIYEMEQFKMLQGYLEGSIPHLLIGRWEKTLGITSLLRLMSQAILLLPEYSNKMKLSERYHLLCKQVSPSSVQELFLQRLPAKSARLMVINEIDQTALYSGKEAPLKNKLFWQLIAAFSENQKSASIDDIIANVYNEEPNLQHFDRLRMGIYRLNAYANETWHIPHLFKITKNTVTLHVEIKGQVS